MPWNITKGKLLIAEKCLETLALNTVPKWAAFPNPNPNCRLSLRQGPQPWPRQKSSRSTALFAASLCFLQPAFCFGSPLPAFPSCSSAFSLPLNLNLYAGTRLQHVPESLPRLKSSHSSMFRDVCLNTRVKASSTAMLRSQVWHHALPVSTVFKHAL